MFTRGRLTQSARWYVAHLRKKKIRSAPRDTTRRRSTVICGVARTQIKIY